MRPGYSLCLVALLTACSGGEAVTGDRSPPPPFHDEESSSPDRTTPSDDAPQEESRANEAPAPPSVERPSSNPNHPTARVARWREALPEECVPHFRHLTHPSGNYALGWVYEGSMPDDEARCEAHRRAEGVLATAHGTTAFHAACLWDSGVEGDFDGDAYPDALFMVDRCAEGRCPGYAYLVRDTESGPRIVDLEGTAENVGDAVWIERDDGTQAIELRPVDESCREMMPDLTSETVRWVWREGRATRE